jgi:hypothetical protein
VVAWVWGGDFLLPEDFFAGGLGAGWGVGVMVDAAVVSAAMLVRQMWAVMFPLMGRLSVVLVGVVHWRMTLSPMRSAVRSVMGRGRLRDGGRGGPGLAQPIKTMARFAMSSAARGADAGRLAGELRALLICLSLAF